MSPREKKLMGLVLVAFVVAVADYLYSALNEFKNESLVASKVEEVRAALGQANARVASLPVTAEAKARLALANEPLPSDPLVRPEASAMTAALAGEQLPFLSASGYIAIGAVRIAIINGGEYAEGDVIPETGEVVARVDAEGVVLNLPETGAQRRLVYAEEAQPAEEIVIR